MPYSKAHFYVLALIPITVLAFWQNYFGRLDEAPIEHHFHGITSTLWILLLAAQSWLIHNNKVSLHELFGKSLFALVPIMVGSFAMVTYAGAIKTVEQHPFYMMFGKALLTGDAILTFAIPLQIFLALKFRKFVGLHSALMLSTVTGLLPPILARLFGAIVPGLMIRGPDTLYRFEYCLLLSFVVSVGFSLFMYWRYKSSGWPWLLAALITASAYIAYATFGQTTLWNSWVIAMANQTSGSFFIFGALLGLAAATIGWIQGKQP